MHQKHAEVVGTEMRGENRSSAYSNNEAGCATQYVYGLGGTRPWVRRLLAARGARIGKGADWQNKERTRQHRIKMLHLELVFSLAVCLLEIFSKVNGLV